MIDKIKEKINYLKNNYKKIWNIFIEDFQNRDKQKKYIIISSLLIVLNILIINVFFTHAYYNDTISIPIASFVVGDYLMRDNDYVLLVYVEDEDNVGTYRLSYGIPSIGYTYGGYNCKNNSTLIYDDVTKKTSVTTKGKDVCSVYFNIDMKADIRIKIMLQEGIDNYIISNDIPSEGYTFNNYECINNSKITYNDDTKKLRFSSNGKDTCTVYFNKKDI